MVNYSIGLDISKSLISVYIPINNQSIEIENSLKGLKKLISKLKKLYKKEFEELIFVYEPTGSYSNLLKRYCSDKQIRCFIINPKRSSNFAKSMGERNKTDKVDAKLLSNAILLAKNEEIKIPLYDERVEEMSTLMRYYQFIVKSRVSLVNHLESITAKNGATYAIDELEKEIKKYREKEPKILLEIAKIINKDDKLKQGFENIKSITGIGDKSATVLLHLFLKYPDANQREITSLVGLDPIEKRSGTSVRGKVRISKAGAKIYRGAMFMTVMVAIRHSEHFKIFFDRLQAKGKHTTLIQIALMRKMVVIAHSLYKNNQKFDDKRYDKDCGRSKEEEKN
jgi:transposase